MSHLQVHFYVHTSISCNAFALIRLGSAERGNNPQVRGRAPEAQRVISEGRGGGRARGTREEERSLIRRPSPKAHVPAVSLTPPQLVTSIVQWGESSHEDDDTCTSAANKRKWSLIAECIILYCVGCNGSPFLDTGKVSTCAWSL